MVPACPVCGACHPLSCEHFNKASDQGTNWNKLKLADQSAKKAGDASQQELRGRLEGQEQLVMKWLLNCWRMVAMIPWIQGFAVGNDFEEIAEAAQMPLPTLKYPGNAGSAAAGDERRAGSFAKN